MPISSKTPIDIDALIAADLAKAKKAAKWNLIKLFGKTWRITTEPNVFATLAGAYGDVEALVSMIRTIIHPDEREEFHKALLAADGINSEVLMTLLNALIEAAGENPTKSSSGSSRSSGTKGAQRKSAAS